MESNQLTQSATDISQGTARPYAFKRISQRLSHLSHWRLVCQVASILTLSTVAVGCSQSAQTTAELTGEPGQLTINANGEDFVRQGFVDKDGWQIDFEHVYVTLANITAAQVEPSVDRESSGPQKDSDPKQAVQLTEPITVDLKSQPEDPVFVSTIENAPSGRYNALYWEVVVPSSGPAEGYSLMMIGTATKEDASIPFTIQLDESLSYDCGAFIGEERKGMLESGDTADLEATFHFDHIFGDGEAPADDYINQGALGFSPLAALASDGTVEVNSESLKEQLSAKDYETFQNVLSSLGHVGEGHCEATNLAEANS